MNEEIEVKVTPAETADVGSAVDDAVKILAVAEAIAEEIADDGEALEVGRAILDEIVSLRQEVRDVYARVGESFDNLSAKIDALGRMEEVTQDIVVAVAEPAPAPPAETVEEVETEKIEIPPEGEDKPIEVEKTKRRKAHWI